nr:uncharacterized protein LOC129387747 [Dermacentor andersoni]
MSAILRKGPKVCCASVWFGNSGRNSRAKFSVSRRTRGCHALSQLPVQKHLPSKSYRLPQTSATARLPPGAVKGNSPRACFTACANKNIQKGGRTNRHHRCTIDGVSHKSALGSASMEGTGVNATSKMRFFSVLFLLGLLVAFLTLASATEDESTEPHLRVRRGFGCPISDFCHKHCLSIGRRGGYCGGKWKLTCICYKS